MNRTTLICVFALIASLGCSTLPGSGKKPRLDTSFFESCAFVSVDIQEGTKPEPVSEAQVPEEWKRAGIVAEDVNAANDFAWNTAFPNAARVAEACRERKLPMIFIHWGYVFKDAMDLDPEIRQSFLKEYGDNHVQWPGHVDAPGSQVAKSLRVREGEYVLAKSAQDAFRSCNIDFLLKNLGVKRIVFVGGHTGACLGKTAKSAKRLGYVTLCVDDATNNACESTRLRDIGETGYDYVMTTEEFLALARQ